MSIFVVPSARVTVTFPVLLSAILNAAFSSDAQTSIFTPARIIFAETPFSTSILCVVGVKGSIFAIVSVVSDLTTSVLLIYT